MDQSKVPRGLLPTSIREIRPIGRPNQTLKLSLLNDIKIFIPSVDKLGSFYT